MEWSRNWLSDDIYIKTLEYYGEDFVMSEITSVTVTAKQASVYLNISYWTMLKLVRTRSIPSIRIGKCLYFKKDSLDKYLEAAEENSLITPATPRLFGKIK